MAVKTTPPEGYTEEDLANLTETEREGLLDEDLTDDGAPAPEAKAEGEETAADAEDTGAQKPAKAEKPAKADAAAEAAADEGDDDDAGTETTTTGEDDQHPAEDAETEAERAAQAEALKAAAANKGEGESEDEAAETAGAGGADEEDDDDPDGRVPDWQLPADHDTKVQAIKDKKADLVQKFDDGDLSAREFQTELDQLSEQAADLRSAADKAQMAHEMRVNTFVHEAVPEFLNEHKQFKTGILHDMLDTEVRRLQDAAIEKGKNPFSARILDRAHANVSKALKEATGAELKDPVPKPNTGKKPANLPNRREPPPTLAKTPATEVEGTDDPEFARLDKLADEDSEAYEDALARLEKANPSRFEAYMATQ